MKNYNLSILFVLLTLLSSLSQADTLKPFVSDGCSAFPDGTMTEKQLWLSCCQSHDYAYWKGGTYDERLKSDKELRVCVSKVGDSRIALLMMAGVRVGGIPYLPTKFRWGYGWSYPRFYGSLSTEELKQVQDLTSNLFIYLINYKTSNNEM